MRCFLSFKTKIEMFRGRGSFRRVYMLITALARSGNNMRISGEGEGRNNKKELLKWLKE